MNLIDSSDKNDMLIFVICGILFLSLLSGFIVYFIVFYRQKQANFLQEKKLAESIYQQELLKALNEIKETTLQYVASELHDNIGQMASVVKMNLMLLPTSNHPNLELSIEMMGNILQEIKTLSKGLKSEFIEEKGWIKALEIDVERINKLGIQIEFNIESEYQNLAADKEIFLYRLCQETLHNILQHAVARNIRINIKESKKEIEIQIEDNGKGFDVNAYLEKDITKKGNGLQSMIKRCKIAGGNYTIESKVGMGTSIQIKLAL